MESTEGQSYKAFSLKSWMYLKFTSMIIEAVESITHTPSSELDGCCGPRLHSKNCPLVLLIEQMQCQIQSELLIKMCFVSCPICIELNRKTVTQHKCTDGNHMYFRGIASIQCALPGLCLWLLWWQHTGSTLVKVQTSNCAVHVGLHFCFRMFFMIYKIKKIIRLIAKSLYYV